MILNGSIVKKQRGKCLSCTSSILYVSELLACSRPVYNGNLNIRRKTVKHKPLGNSTYFLFKDKNSVCNSNCTNVIACLSVFGRHLTHSNVQLISFFRKPLGNSTYFIFKFVYKCFHTERTKIICLYIYIYMKKNSENRYSENRKKLRNTVPSVVRYCPMAFRSY